MKRLHCIAVLVVSVGGCKRCGDPAPPSAVSTDAAVVEAAANDAFAADASTEASSVETAQVETDNDEPPDPPPTEDRSGSGTIDFNPIVIAKKPYFFVIRENGKFRIAGNGAQIYVEGDGPAVRGDPPSFIKQRLDLEKTVPHDEKKHWVSIIGSPPHVFALRSESNLVCGQIVAPTVFMRREDDTWSEVKALAARPLMDEKMHVAWKDGALLVDSQTDNCSYVQSGPVDPLDPKSPGTRFTQIGPDGTLSFPRFGLDPTFIFWDSDGEMTGTLSLIGTFGRLASDTSGTRGTRDIAIMRRRDPGSFEPITILRGQGFGMHSVRTKVKELGAATLVWPPPVRDNGKRIDREMPEGGDERAWEEKANRLFFIKDGSKTPIEYVFRTKAETMCSVDDADVVTTDADAGEQTEVYAIVKCHGLPSRLVRAGKLAKGEKRMRFELPLFEPNGPDAGPRIRCNPRRVSGHGTNDLYVVAECPSGATKYEVVFRRGHPQEPIVVVPP